MIEIRKGQAPAPLSRQAFGERYRSGFADPAFATETEAIARLESIAWLAYAEGRKALLTRPAGAGYADPTYALPTEWLATQQAIDQAQLAWGKPATKSRVLPVYGSARNDGSCPGEVSKTWGLTEIAAEVVQDAGVEADLLDPSLVTSEYGRTVHPCKGCVSSAMPLCHWPCSCYPNHALAQTHDWMAEIYERWVAAHAVILLTPTYWYQSPSPLKLRIERLVCADGGNPDPTTTHGKHVAEAKQIEALGWGYPKHLAGRAFGVVVYGDVAGVEDHRRNLCDWMAWMGLIDAGTVARLDRYIGYYEPYYNSHEALDKDNAMQQEVRNVARSVLGAVLALRAGRLSQPDRQIKSPRPK
jgi:multimeric flavodoxin WrbA